MLTLPLLGGGYLRLPVSLAGAVVTLRALCQEGQEKRAPDYGRRQHAAAISVSSVTPGCDKKTRESLFYQ